MTTAKLTSKGRITVPVEVRRRLRVAVGDHLQFLELEPGRYEIVAAARSVRELKGMFGKAKRSVSIAEMNSAITRKSWRRY